MSEFREMFPTGLSGMPPDKDINFCIDLELGTRPISIPPYRMAQRIQESLRLKSNSFLIRDLIFLVLPHEVLKFC